MLTAEQTIEVQQRMRTFIRDLFEHKLHSVERNDEHVIQIYFVLLDTLHSDFLESESIDELTKAQDKIVRMMSQALGLARTKYKLM